MNTENKECPVCGEILPPSQFKYNRDCCEVCYAALTAEAKANSYKEVFSKTCTCCGRKRLDKFFNKSSKHIDGLLPHCKDCSAEKKARLLSQSGFVFVGREELI